jgi:branched-chain amino acid transport system substrate-binding protein
MKMHSRRVLQSLGVATVAMFVAAGCGSSSKGTSSPTTASGSSATTASGGTANTASAPGVTPTTVTMGFVYDETGIASSTFADAINGAEARIAAQNANGGVKGRTLKIVSADTTSSPTGANTAAQTVVQEKGAFAVDEVSALFFGAYKSLQESGIPVTGSSLDGPEWYTQPNTNMFNIEGTSSPQYPAYSTEGQFWKSIGVSKISLVASNTPSSTSAIAASKASILAAGLQTCADAVVPLGGVDFTATALSIKAAGCNAAECSCVLSSSLSLATAIQNQGLTMPVEFGAGPSQGVFASPATEKAATGGYFPATIYYSGPQYTTFTNSLKQYDPTYKGGIPDLGLTYGWMTADLFIKGLQLAGQNPTRSTYIANLRPVTNYNANGLKPTDASFTPFGVAPTTGCGFYVKFQNNQYNDYPTNGKPLCGTLIKASTK